MTKAQLTKLLIESFPYKPTEGQINLLEQTSEFLLDTEENNLLVINGYAGTGKTSIVKAITDVLNTFKHECLLLAPTGRSAKVLSSYTQKQAFTIHKKIYRIHLDNNGYTQCSLLPNIHKNTLFIVDEASLIADYSTQSEGGFSSGRSLLADLINFIYNGNNNRLIIIGDAAQLPPIGMNESPALNLKFLNASFGLNIRSCELTEVVRQEENSGILQNATLLRKAIISNNSLLFKFQLKGFNDIIKLDSCDLEDAINQAYSTYSPEETMIICRANKKTNLFNKQIRYGILGREEKINGGDYLMCVKNNYYWLDENTKPGFLANGDIMQVNRVKKTHQMYDFNFAEVSFTLCDYPDDVQIEAMIMLDTIDSENASLTYSTAQQFYEKVVQDYMDIPNKNERLKEVKKNPFLNAIQVKYAYAMTCHKSQGGQWKAVFVDQDFYNESMENVTYLRWLYTALTRASEKIYLVNFAERFFEK